MTFLSCGREGDFSICGVTKSWYFPNQDHFHFNNILGQGARLVMDSAATAIEY